MDEYNYVILGERKVGDDYQPIFYIRSRQWRAKCCALCTDLILDEIGDGDGENGDAGSLRNLWDDAFEMLLNEGEYEYADCRFRVVALDSGPRP